METKNYSFTEKDWGTFYSIINRRLLAEAVEKVKPCTNGTTSIRDTEIELENGDVAFFDVWALVTMHNYDGDYMTPPDADCEVRVDVTRMTGCDGDGNEYVIPFEYSEKFSC